MAKLCLNRVLDPEIYGTQNYFMPQYLPFTLDDLRPLFPDMNFFNIVMLMDPSKILEVRERFVRQLGQYNLPTIFINKLASYIPEDPSRVENFDYINPRCAPS